MADPLNALNVLPSWAKPGEQRRRRPEASVGAGHEPRCAAETRATSRQARLVRVEHGSAAVGRKAVAVEIDDVDVRTALRDAVLDDARTFVDRAHRCSARRSPASLTARAASASLLRRYLLDDRVDLRVRDRAARARLVAIPPGAGLLAEAARLTEHVGHIGEIPVGKFGGAPLAHRPTDVEAGQIAHAKRAHRHAEFLQRRVDLLRQRARHEQIVRPPDCTGPPCGCR